jgi:hypothetical protein
MSSIITTTHQQDVFQRQPACRDKDPELFFPVGTSPAALFRADQARRICFSCPLLEACADQAMARREEHGIWGGLDESDRRWLRRRVPALTPWPTLEPARRRELLRAVVRRQRHGAAAV